MAKGKIYEAICVERSTERRGRDFSMKVDEHRFGCFSSRKNAEKGIMKSVEDFSAAVRSGYKRPGDLLGFYVQETMLDRTLSDNDAWGQVTEAVWSYTPDGRLFSYSPFSSDWKAKEYAGTPPDAVMFAVGDYAWAHYSGRFVPVRVLATPYTPDEWRKRFKGMKSDASDDCYLAMCPSGHLHPQTETLFPMDIELPGKIILEIENETKKYYEG